MFSFVEITNEKKGKRKRTEREQGQNGSRNLFWGGAILGRTKHRFSPGLRQRGRVNSVKGGGTGGLVKKELPKYRHLSYKDGLATLGMAQ